MRGGGSFLYGCSLFRVAKKRANRERPGKNLTDREWRQCGVGVRDFVAQMEKQRKKKN
jgi:hypothetical protein